MYFTYYSSPFGKISLTANNEGLTSLAFIDSEQNTIMLPHYRQLQQEQDVFAEVCRQLDQYFAKQRVNFNLKLAPQGTQFQQQVWQALTTIKHGDTKSYAWLAKEINNEKAVRAVGSANGANPITLIIPCHRVIGTNGKLTGYAGGLALKAKLLEFEDAEFIKEQ